MMRDAKLGAFALLAAVPAAAIAQVPETAECLSYSELQAVSRFMLPSAVSGLVETCRASVGAQAFFRTGAPALVSRLRAEAGTWESAAPIFTKISKAVAGTSLGGEFASGEVVDQLVKTAAEQIQPGSCPEVDKGFAALAKLPASHMVDFLATVFVVFGGLSDMKICEAG